MNSVKVIPANKEIIESFYGSVPRTMYAIAVLKDEKPMALYGFYIDGTRAAMFSEVKYSDGIKKSLLKAGKQIVEMAKEMNLPLHAVPENGCTSRPFLKHLGFEESRFGVWICHSQ